MTSEPAAADRHPAPDRVSPLGAASRALAAVLGGYALASVFAALLACALPLPRGDAVTAAAIPSFAVYVAAVIWAFAARSAARAWVGLLAPGAAMAAACALLARAAP